MQHYPSPLHTLSSDSLSRQHFKAAIKVKISLKRKQRCGWETVCILANIFSTHHKLGLSGKVTRFPVRNILEVVRNGGRETQKECSRFCVWSSGTKQHDHAEHHENVPQRDEDSKVSEAQQELPDVVTCAGLPRLLPKALRVLLFPLVCCDFEQLSDPPWTTTCPANHSYDYSHRRGGGGGPRVPDVGLRIHVRAKRFSGDGLSWVRAEGYWGN